MTKTNIIFKTTKNVRII